MKTFITVPLVVEAIQFDGSFSVGQKIKDAFPQNQIELVYEYGRTRYKLRIFNPQDQRYAYILEGSWAVRGALGELFIHRDNLFQAMFSETKNKS